MCQKFTVSVPSEKASDPSSRRKPRTDVPRGSSSIDSNSRDIDSGGKNLLRKGASTISVACLDNLAAVFAACRSASSLLIVIHA